MKLLAVLTAIIVLVVTTDAIYGSDCPKPVQIENYSDKMATVVKQLNQYRQGLESWSTTCQVKTVYTKDYFTYFEAERGHKIGQKSWAERVTVEVAKSGLVQMTIQELDLEGKPIGDPIIGDQAKFSEQLNLIMQALFARAIVSKWDFYAGVPKDYPDSVELWVANAPAGGSWSAYYLDSKMGYLPLKIEDGTYETGVPPDLTYFSGYRKIKDRWIVGEMASVQLLPDDAKTMPGKAALTANKPGIVTTVRVEKFDFVPKPEKKT